MIRRLISACVLFFLAAAAWAEQPQSIAVLLKALTDDSQPEQQVSTIEQLEQQPATLELVRGVAAVLVEKSSTENVRDHSERLILKCAYRNRTLFAPRELIRGLQSTPEIRRRTISLLGAFRSFELDGIPELVEQVKQDDLLFAWLSQTFVDVPRLSRLTDHDDFEIRSLALSSLWAATHDLDLYLPMLIKGATAEMPERLRLEVARLDAELERRQAEVRTLPQDDPRLEMLETQIEELFKNPARRESFQFQSFMLGTARSSRERFRENPVQYASALSRIIADAKFELKIRVQATIELGLRAHDDNEDRLSFVEAGVLKVVQRAAAVEPNKTLAEELTRCIAELQSPHDRVKPPPFPWETDATKPKTLENPNFAANLPPFLEQPPLYTIPPLGGQPNGFQTFEDGTSSIIWFEQKAPPSFETLLKMLPDDKNPEQQIEAIQRLQQFPPTPDLVQRVTQVLINQTTSTEVREAAEMALTQFVKRERSLCAPRELVEALRMPPHIRRRAIKVLGGFRRFESSSIPELIERTKADDVLFVWLSESFTDVPRLCQLTEHPDDEVKLKALANLWSATRDLDLYLPLHVKVLTLELPENIREQAARLNAEIRLLQIRTESLAANDPKRLDINKKIASRQQLPAFERRKNFDALQAALASFEQEHFNERTVEYGIALSKILANPKNSTTVRQSSIALLSQLAQRDNGDRLKFLEAGILETVQKSAVSEENSALSRALAACVQELQTPHDRAKPPSAPVVPHDTPSFLLPYLDQRPLNGGWREVKIPGADFEIAPDAKPPQFPTDPARDVPPLGDEPEE